MVRANQNEKKIEYIWEQISKIVDFAQVMNIANLKARNSHIQLASIEKLSREKL
jgi:acetolactate synthase small subunit